MNCKNPIICDNILCTFKELQFSKSDCDDFNIIKTICTAIYKSINTEV